MFGYDALDGDFQEIQYQIDMIGQEIVNYCNVTSVPIGLKYNYIDAVCGKILQHKLSTNSLPNLTPVINGVSSIKQGDTQVTFGATTQSEQLAALLASLALTPMMLNRFRRLIW